VTASYANGSSRDVTAAATGTQYTISNSTIATITGNGLVRAAASGTVLIQATHEGTSGIIAVQIAPATGDTDGDGIPDTTVTEIVSRTRTRNRFGWYGHAEIQPWRRWAFGGRYDWTEFPEGRGSEWAVGPYVSFMPSEFLRFRLGYKHTERSRAASSITGVPGGRSIDEVLLQGTFLLGAHPAHPF
jgi:hypothetical protein